MYKDRDVRSFPLAFQDHANMRQNGQHFPDDIFKCIFLNENILVLSTIWLKFVPEGPIDNNTTLVQIMAWRQTGDKPLSEPMMA